MRYSILFVLLLTLLAACRKDTEQTTIREIRYTPPVVRVNGTLAGIVTDDQGTPLAGATVRLGNLEQTTGQGGHFLFANAPLNANGTFVSVSHQGYFHASRRLWPKPNSTHYVALRLIPRQVVGQVPAIAGGTVALPNGVRITLPANGIIHTDGSPYTGQVEVAAHWLRPNSPDLDLLMPGNLTGINRDNQEVALASYGMVAVALLSPTGQRLQLAEGAEAELFVPLPAAMQATAPAEIPLWHFDEDTGLWREESKAVRQANGYVGNVPHFSFWNLDAPFPAVNVQGQVVDNQGNGIPNMRIRIARPDMALVAGGYTDANGLFNGPVPAGEPLVLQVVSPCGSAVVEQAIPPLSDDTDLGTILAGDAQVSQLSGSLLNCDGQPVQRGIVRACWGNGCQYLMANADGTFNTPLVHCGAAEVSIAGIDLDAALTSNAANFPIGTNIETGAITVCDAPVAEFIKVVFDGQQRTFLLPYTFRNSGNLRVIANAATHTIIIIVPDTEATGTFDAAAGASFSYLEYIFQDGMWTGNTASCSNGNECTGLAITITEHGPVGGFIRGNFTFTTLSAGNTTHPNTLFTGEFAVVRTE